MNEITNTDAVAILQEIVRLGTPPCCFALDADERQAIDLAIAALQAQAGEAHPGDRFEQFLRQSIAQSPAPLRELGAYLSDVLDEDQFPKADRLLLQIATSYAHHAPQQPVESNPHAPR